MNCKSLESIARDCSSGIGGIRPFIHIVETKEVDFDAATFDGTETHLITSLTSSEIPETVEFRNDVGSLTEAYTLDPSGATVFTQTLSLPLHGRDASKSRKITVMASGQRRLDIIVQQNDGQYVYLRDMVLSEVGEGTGTAKTDGSQYALTFTGVSEHSHYYIDKSTVEDLLDPQ